MLDPDAVYSRGTRPAHLRQFQDACLQIHSDRANNDCGAAPRQAFEFPPCGRTSSFWYHGPPGRPASSCCQALLIAPFYAGRSLNARHETLEQHCLWPVYSVQQLPHNFPLESEMTWLLLTLVSAHQTAAVRRGRAGDAGANRIESQYHG